MPAAIGGAPSVLTGMQRPRKARNAPGGRQDGVLTGGGPRPPMGGGGGPGGGGTINPNLQAY
jgi:hypothetical protein